jgi:ADP-heptose:LPS heptosyltransferase
MEKFLNFIAGGLLGDFINSLYVVKNLCERENCKANIYLSNGGEPFRHGLDVAYKDLHELVINQPYINSFKIFNEDKNDYIKLYTWRGQAEQDFNNGGYNKSWSELFSSYYFFNIPESYKWIFLNLKEDCLKDSILIHRSNRRINPKYDLYKFIDDCNKKNQEVSFLVCSEDDFYVEGHKKYVPKTINEMAIFINSCKYFLGNQSSPLALASGLDVPRLAILDLDFNNYVFYENEKKYSKNIDCFIR